MLEPLSGTFSRANKILRTQLNNRPWLVLGIFGAMAFGLFTVYSIQRYLAFQTNFFDLGLDANSIWRTLNGYDSWPSLIFPSTPGHINHISPILGLVAILYALVPDPRTLLVIQAATVTFAAVPLYLIAWRETHDQLLSLIISGLFLANPALHGVIRFDFHPESFIPLFVFLIYFSYPRRTSALFYLSLTLLFATIEYSAILGLGIGVSFWIAERRMDNRILVTLLGSLTLSTIIILSTIGGVFHLWNWPANWLAVQFLGTSSSSAVSYAQAATGFWSHPEILLGSIQNNFLAKMTFLGVATAPMWFSLAKYAVRIIPAVPWIAVVIVTSRYSYSNVNFQYSVFLIPFVYLAAVPFLRGIMKERKLVIGLILSALSITLLYSALSPTYPQWPAASPLSPTVESIDRALPQNATVLTESDLFPQLSNRAFVTLNESSPVPPQYILVNIDSSWYDWTNPAQGYPLSPREQVQRLTTAYPYELILIDQGLRLYRFGGAAQISLDSRHISQQTEELLPKMALFGLLSIGLIGLGVREAEYFLYEHSSTDRSYKGKTRYGSVLAELKERMTPCRVDRRLAFKEGDIRTRGRDRSRPPAYALGTK